MISSSPVVRLLVNAAVPVSVTEEGTSATTPFSVVSTILAGRLVSFSVTVYLPGTSFSSVAVLLWPLVMVMVAVWLVGFTSAWSVGPVTVKV